MRFLSNFTLRIIAIIAMTFDHIGKMLYLFYPTLDSIRTINNAFSIIGRLAFPIFIFLLIEGFYHTSNFKKYLSRVGVMAIIIYIAELIIGLVPGIADNASGDLLKFGNIFIDLIVTLIFMKLITSESNVKKTLALLPLGYLTLFTFIQNDFIYVGNSVVQSFVAGLAPQYSFVTLVILIVYALYTLLKNFYIYNKAQVKLTSRDLFVTKSFENRTLTFAITILLSCLIFYGLTYVKGLNLNTDFVNDTYFLLAIIPIFFYNGKLGYNNKYIKSAYYLYYPLSLCIIYLIVSCISM